MFSWFVEIKFLKLNSIKILIAKRYLFEMISDSITVLLVCKANIILSRKPNISLLKFCLDLEPSLQTSLHGIRRKNPQELDGKR